MPSIWNDDARVALLARLDKLTPETKPKWGQFTVGRMMQHCADALRMATGELPVKPKSGPFKLPVLKHLIIYVLPWPQGAPTAPELIPAGDPNLAVAIAAVKSGIFRLAAADPATQQWAAHPAFGKLSRRTWGALIHRHMDHHLKQFGV